VQRTERGPRQPLRPLELFCCAWRLPLILLLHLLLFLPLKCICLPQDVRMKFTKELNEVSGCSNRATLRDHTEDLRRRNGRKFFSSFLSSFSSGACQFSFELTLKIVPCWQHFSPLVLSVPGPSKLTRKYTPAILSQHSIFSSCIPSTVPSHEIYSFNITDSAGDCFCQCPRALQRQSVVSATPKQNLHQSSTSKPCPGW